MLQIKNISKHYIVGDLMQIALNSVSLNFRDNEFVAILGPSGSGKTTLLNIIGGLDRCDTGDLIINNISTSNYKDCDWDMYRNHVIGFVFQPSNLISNLTILTNVELALTIAGVSRKERKERALLALNEVGLRNQAHKKPNQLSSGQIQRVAIARALVNNPDVLLVDEPTSTLDEKSSSQAMNLLKEVAKDRLVIMITNNPNLANVYANRIIKLQDGVVVSDSNPFVTKETIINKKVVRSKKTHVSFFDKLLFSLKNLVSKKGRTILTIFTVSLGIISVALILSLLYGLEDYVDKVQKDNISDYPLTISSDFSNIAPQLLSMAVDKVGNDTVDEKIIETQYLTKTFSTIGTNDLKSFKKFVEDNKERIEKCTNQICYSYSVVPQIYTIDASNKLVKLNPSSNLLFDSEGIFFEMANNVDSIKSQYDLLKGRWPNKYDELIIVLPEANSISDLFTYSLGLRNTSELKSIIIDAMNNEEISVNNDPLELTYDDLINIELKLVKAADTYKFNDKYLVYEDMNEDKEYMKHVYDNSIKLKIVGIVCPSDDTSSATLSAGVYYTEELTQYVINQAANTAIVQNQLKNKDVDIFSLKRFDAEDEEKIKIDFKDMISVDYDLIKESIQINSNLNYFDVDQDAIKNEISQYTTNMISSLTTDVTPAKTDFENTLKILCKNYINDYINKYQEEGKIKFKPENKFLFNQIYYSSNSFYSPISELIDKYAIPTSSVLQLNSAYGILTGLIFDEIYVSFDSETPVASITDDIINPIIDEKITSLQSYPIYNNKVAPIASGMTVSIMSNAIGKNVEKIVGTCLEPLDEISNSFGISEDMITIDKNKFSKAIKFNIVQDELSRIMSIVNSDVKEKTYKNNLVSLGYQDKEEPTSISFYFKDNESKKIFMDIIDEYNDELDNKHKLNYSDISGVLMSNVNTIIDNIAFVLNCFILIILLIPSFTIAVITSTSVAERKQEIGILKAFGASKQFIFSIFNSEIFIVGLLSSLLGVGITYLAIPQINKFIYYATNSYEINIALPLQASITLVIITVTLSMIVGLIPSRKAAKLNPIDTFRY